MGDQQGTTGDSSRWVTICVPSIRPDTVSKTIASILQQTTPNWELIVVMQGEDEQLRSHVSSAESSDHRIRGHWIRDRGVSRARNAGVELAAHDVIAFLDDDCEADPSWLERSLAALAADDSVGVVAGALVAPQRSRRGIATCPESIPRDFTYRPADEGPELPDGAAFVTANLMMSRAAWETVGPFDEQLGAGMPFRGGEDLDLLLRIVGAELPLRFAPRSVVHHTYGTRSGFRAAFDVSTAYGSGQGAVAAKLSLRGQSGEEWRRTMRQACLLEPLRSLRWHRIPPRLPRLVAFERAFRKCLRDYTVDEDGMLVPLDRPPAD